MVAKVDIYGLEEIFEKNAERYISRLFPEDRADVRRFVDELLLRGYSAARINKYLASLVSISRRLGKPFKDAEVDDIKRYVARLQRSDYKEWTKRDLKVILRRYMRWLGKGEAVAWMEIKHPKSSKLPEEVLTEEEIKAIAEAAYTTRDRAFVLALYESSARIASFCR